MVQGEFEMKPVAICISLLQRKRHVESKIPGWTDWLEQQGIPYEYVDCYSYDIISKLSEYSALLWHYSNFVNADLMEAQHILDIAETMGLKVFPNHNTGWHFDDKIAEMYALQAAGAPIPNSWVFYELDECINWLNSEAKYPLVAKLRRGSGSNNVKLLKTSQEATRYAKRMFGRGYQPAPSLLYKTYSKVQSTKDWKTLVHRFKQIPNFLWSRRYGMGMPYEKGYCYFQQFIENDGFDIKIAVVKDKCSFLIRDVRKGDFRASGSGSIYYQKDLVTDRMIDAAFHAADGIGMQCVGLDYVVDKESGRGMIVEMCFGFDEEAIYDAGGYWDREHVWHDEPLNVPVEVLRVLLDNERPQ